MTVSYASDVANSRNLGCFLHILTKWRGSIYKLVWPDLVLFLLIYYSINLVYRFVLQGESKLYFEKIVNYCDTYGTLIPVSFVLGFYVTNIMTRWWNQYCSIPFPDNLALLVSASIKGENERARIIRRTIMRYNCVAFAMTLSLVSPKIKKRFPTLEHYVQTGLLLPDEKRIIENIEEEFPSYSKYWLPLAWASNIATRARHEGLIREDVSVKSILDELNIIRSKLGSLLDYDWISMPLVYTQVVTLAVYTYFVTTLLGKQYIETEANEVDLYFPILPVMEFFFYMGWLKVAEVLINPFGEDDEDFEVAWMIDRNIQVSYLIVDKMHHEHPKLMRDHHWAKVAPNKLPYTLASEQYISEYPSFSASKMSVAGKQQEVIEPDEGARTYVFKEIDGTGALGFFARFLGGARRRRNRGHRKSGVHHVVEEMKETDFPSVINLSKTSDTSDFEKLKQERQLHHRNRTLQIVDLLHSKAASDIGHLTSTEEPQIKR